MIALPPLTTEQRLAIAERELAELKREHAALARDIKDVVKVSRRFLELCPEPADVPPASAPDFPGAQERGARIYQFNGRSAS